MTEGQAALPRNGELGVGTGSISSRLPTYSHSTHTEQQQFGAGVRCLEHSANNPDMAADLWDWQFGVDMDPAQDIGAKTVCDARMGPCPELWGHGLIVGFHEHPRKPSPGGFIVMLWWGRGRVRWAEGTACAKGWGGCEKTPGLLACRWRPQEPAHSLAGGRGEGGPGGRFGGRQRHHSPHLALPQLSM